MDAFVWNRHFTTGLERVDSEHHQLVVLINRLGDALINGEVAEQSLQATFAQLADYAQHHFAEEERLMAEAGVSPLHRDPHRRHHAEFVEHVATMWSSRSSMANPAETLHGFLSSWLGFHILGEDQSMARQIALIRSGRSPEQAYAEDRSSHGDHATSALLAALHNLYHVLSVQNRDLAAANSRLEERVAARTAELANANQSLQDLNDRLRALSNSDGLLEIANRRHFDMRLDEEWRRAQRQGQALSLLLIDVDHFKRYNDHYGHQAGDRCLQAVAGAARAALRRPGDLLARYGGEELAVVLPVTELQGATRVGESIRRAVDELCIPHADSPVANRVTVSIGAASMVPDQRTNSAMLVAAADRGLYAAKEGGRNRICAGRGADASSRGVQPALLQ